MRRHSALVLLVAFLLSFSRLALCAQALNRTLPLDDPSIHYRPQQSWLWKTNSHLSVYTFDSNASVLLTFSGDAVSVELHEALNGNLRVLLDGQSTIMIPKMPTAHASLSNLSDTTHTLELFADVGGLEIRSITYTSTNPFQTQKILSTRPYNRMSKGKRVAIELFICLAIFTSPFIACGLFLVVVGIGMLLITIFKKVYQILCWPCGLCQDTPPMPPAPAAWIPPPIPMTTRAPPLPTAPLIPIAVTSPDMDGGRGSSSHVESPKELIQQLPSLSLPTAAPTAILPPTS